MTSVPAPWRHAALGFCVVAPVLFAIAAALMPQDANWDLANYHWYNPYALLNGRMGFDLAPAQTPTYYNPLLDVPLFLAAQVLPARIIAFLLGLLQGCNTVLLFLLARATLRTTDMRFNIAVAATVATVGMVGAGHIGLIGTTFYDNILSLFFLGALLIIVRARDLLLHGTFQAALKPVVCAGFVVGLAVGLKLPAQVFAVGVCFALLFIPGPFMRRFWLSFANGLGVIAGFALTGGWWIARMWGEFQNPLFPYMNHIFKSPWAMAENYRDVRFLPESAWEVLAFPFRFVADSRIASEITFTDGRLAAAYTVLLITAVVLVVKRFRSPHQASADIVDPFVARYLTAAAALTYVSWLAVFAIYRYVTALEMLAPLLIVIGIALWPLSMRARAAATAAVLLLVTVAIDAREDWTRASWRPGLGGPFVDVQPPTLPNPDNTIILMAGLAPTSFAIPFFPPQVAFLRPVSYLAGPDHDTRFIATIKTRIAAHTGDFFVLLPEWEGPTAAANLPRLGLTPDLTACRPVPNTLDPALRLCPVFRRP